MSDPAAGMSDETVSAFSRDQLIDGRVELLQPKSGYRVGVDPMLLAAAVSAEPGSRIADLGCGVGAAALCLLARQPAVSVVGLEIHSVLAALARQNADLNRLTSRFRVIEGDVRNQGVLLEPRSFDQVICNPPYLPEKNGRPSPDPLRDVANRESGARLKDWVDAALNLVRPRGRVTFIHRADRLDALLAAFSGRAGEILVFPLWPRQGTASKRLIIRAREGVAGPLKMLPGLVLHSGDGFSPDAETVLRRGQGLDLTSN